jgi:LacI family transcriptional regulator
MAEALSERPVGLREIAAVAAVSVSTVSRVLNGRDEGLAEETVRRVLSAFSVMKANGVPLKPTLRRKRGGKTLALLVSTAYFAPTTQVTMEVLQAAMAATAGSGYDLVSHGFGATGETSLQEYLDTHVNLGGIILHRLADEDVGPACDLAAARGIPCVLLDRTSPHRHVHTCSMDHGACGRLAAEHLLELGHRRLGVVFGPLVYQSSRERLAAIRAACEAHDCPQPEAHWLTGVRESEDLDPILDHVRTHRLTALITANDRLAARLMSAASLRGIRVPEQLSVLAYDNTEIAECANPPLTSVRVQWRAMARAATGILLQQAQDPQLGGVQMQWQPLLVVRRSCAPPEPGR